MFQPRALNILTARKYPLLKVCSLLLYHLDSLSEESLFSTVWQPWSTSYVLTPSFPSLFNSAQDEQKRVSIPWNSILKACDNMPSHGKEWGTSPCHHVHLINSRYSFCWEQKSNTITCRGKTCLSIYRDHPRRGLSVEPWPEHSHGIHKRPNQSDEIHSSWLPPVRFPLLFHFRICCLWWVRMRGNLFLPYDKPGGESMGQSFSPLFVQ